MEKRVPAHRHQRGELLAAIGSEARGGHRCRQLLLLLMAAEQRHWVVPEDLVVVRSGVGAVAGARFPPSPRGRGGAAPINHGQAVLLMHVRGQAEKLPPLKDGLGRIGIPGTNRGVAEQDGAGLVGAQLGPQGAVPMILGEARTTGAGYQFCQAEGGKEECVTAEDALGMDGQHGTPP